MERLSLAPPSRLGDSALPCRIERKQAGARRGGNAYLVCQCRRFLGPDHLRMRSPMGVSKVDPDRPKPRPKLARHYRMAGFVNGSMIEDRHSTISHKPFDHPNASGTLT
jgi:hypothetical protein